MSLREETLTVARSYVRVPWLHQGRSRRGVDCVGLPVCVAREMGWTTKDYTAYGYQPDWNQLRALMNENLARIQPHEIDLADILVFTVDGLPHVAIVGNMGAPWSIIHAYQPQKRVVENIYDSAWIPQVRGIYRYKPIAEEEASWQR